MTHSNNKIFQFCPNCGGKLSQNFDVSYKFCPFCGYSLLAFIEKDYSEKECEENTKKRMSTQETKETIVFPPPQIPPSQAPRAEKKKSPVTEKEYKYYSVILKDCPHIEKLGRRLEGIFIRNYFAIKLALDNMPSVIVYKSNVSNMAFVIEAFYLENAAISVIAGNFNLYANVHEQYPVLHKQPAGIQNILRFSPSKLWLGDKIHIAVHAKTQSRTGALAVTDQGLYFLDYPGGSAGCRWLITPYYRVSDISHFEDENGFGLSVCCQANQEDSFCGDERQKFYITEEGQAKKVLDLTLLSFETGNYRQRMLLYCSKCNHRQVEILGGGSIDEYCPQCGGPFEMSLLAKARP